MSYVSYAIPYTIVRSTVMLLGVAILTILLEAPFILIGFRKSTYKHKVLLCILVNLLTNIALNSVLMSVASFRQDLGIIVLFEIAVLIAEMLLYKAFLKDITPRRIITISAMANVFSFLWSFVLDSIIVAF